ncbi:Receptor-like serine/threonine-protein kinase [Forsythia ovata]|uniref:non-specific serine/threonine protein kinase n=1 Tax=Forsythia ovata TaxID=205694 RepID=A0ABD1WRV9_9LAMI
MLAVWMGTQADEACPEAWHSDSHSMNQTSLADTRSKVYFSPKLYYLRVHVIAAQDLVPSEKGQNLETSVRSQLPPTTPPVHHQTTRHLVPPLAGGLTAAISFIILLTLCFRRIRKKRTAPSASDTDSKKPPHRLSYSLLRRATNNFSSSLRLGQGGFGSVYRATLKTNPITKNSSFHVAVKLMDAGSLQGEREFQNELLFSSKIDCKYIVSVMGFSSNPGKRRMLLVYELMENGSLQDCLFHRKSEELKNWDKRFLIALHIAKGLEYLHHYCDPPIIHGDIKPSNILLDGNFSAKIGDFGLARSKVEDNIESEVKKEGNLGNGVEDNGSVVEETESVITASGFEDFNNVHNLGGVERSPDSVVVRVEASPEAVVGVELSPEADAADVVSPRTVAEMASPYEGLDKTSISEGNFDSMNQTSLADTRSKVYFSPKLYYLRVHVIAAQDLVPSEKGQNLETSVRSQLPPTTPPVHHQTTRHLVPPLAGGLTAAVSFIILLTLCFRRIRKKRTAPSASDTDSKKPPHRLSYSLLRRATNNFSSSLRLGQGGFGSVYRATLKTNPITKNSSFHVAVKLMDAGSLQGERVFQNELLFSSKIDCKYIVSVMGFSSNPGKRRMLLVYELMENGSLQDCLFHRKSEELKNWDKRFLIALHIAKGLEYLHHYCDPPIIHGDIKPSNILLDGNFSAKIGDFGLARSKVEDNIESEVKKEGNLGNGVEDNGSVVEETESVITASGFEDFNNVHNLGGVERSPDSVVVRVEASPEAVVGVELSPEADAAAVVSPRTVAEMASPSEGLDKTSISEGNFDRGQLKTTPKQTIYGLVEELNSFE